MRFKENDLIAEAYAKVYEAKKKPSAGLTKKQKSDVAKKARAGKDIGKKGPGFAKMAKAAGGGEKGKKIAAAAMWKSIKRESADILAAYEGKELLAENVETLDESDPMIPKVEKILQKMTEEYGSEERAIEELSKWDEDDMNEYYNNHIMSEEDINEGVYDPNSIERVILQFTDSDGEFYQLPPLEYEEDTGNWTAYGVDTFAFIDKDALQNVFVEVQVRTKPNAPQPKKVIFQLSDDDGGFHQVPLEYHEDTGNWSDTTDLFNLLDKDLLQNPHVEVQVHS